MTWVNLETETASERDWVAREYNLGQYVLLTDEVLLRFVASDYYDDSVVEAAVDDIEITGCPHSVDVVPASVQVLTPSGGESIEEGTEYEITWDASDDYGIRHFTVLASYDGGSTYNDTVGVAGGFDNSLMWDVPLGDYPDSKIGIEATDRGYNTSFDESDATFWVKSVSGVQDQTLALPERVQLLGSERNPFTGSTHIFFAVPRKTAVTISIYDAQGRLTRQLVNTTAGAGYHSALWDGRSGSGARAAPGLYFVRLDTETVGLTSKVVLVE
jgi:hypothetical protein